MKKMIETINTLLVAAWCSFAFCWRNNKKETVVRIILTVAGTCIVYLTLQSNGLIINVVQELVEKGGNKLDTLGAIADSGLIGPFVLLAVVMVLGLVLSRLNWFFRSRWNQKLRIANQRELDNHRATLDVARFRSKEYDDLQKRIQETPSAWHTRIAFSEEMFSVFTAASSFVLFGISLLWYQPIYAAILVAVSIPMVVVEFRTGAMWWNLYHELVPHHKKRSVLEKPYRNPAAFVQALMFHQMPALRKEIDINLGTVLDSYNKIRSVTLRKEMFAYLPAVLGLCGVIAHAVWATITGGGEIGTLVVVIAAAKTFQGDLGGIVSIISEQWNSARGVLLIEKEFLGLRAVVKTEHPVIPDPNIVPHIRFDHVCFAYPDTEKLVLTNVSFEIEPGSKVAIVGKSGGGKSTISSLLMRHYDPTSGRVVADATDLRNIEPHVWSDIASALTQEYVVLERSIREEIASSRLDRGVDDAAVASSARFADFDEVVSSDPHGYNSQIGVEFGGREFSGGERQRLALARVHYRGTPILILDEPDAKLDPESAQKVIDEVLALRGITVIMITHHVSRAERCDRVIVMGKGKVVEQGTHEELMARGGTYASMCESDRKRLGVV